MSPAEYDVPFNRLHTTGRELKYIEEAIGGTRLSSGGPFAARCNEWLEQATGCKRALLTHTCTGALEMAALLARVGPGDEVIMPSFSFVSTANAFVLTGATPVFVDIRPDTLNIDETLVEAAITDRTRAIVVVHYGGVACEMNALRGIAERHDLLLIEDAAHAILSTYFDEPLGGIGDLATLSFHETKNVISGEGGVLLVRDADMVERAEVLLEKGTNRKAFLRGQVDKYSWVDVGSSFGASELMAAFLWAQLEDAREITERRLAIWNAYNVGFAELETAGLVRRPVVPDGAHHGGHLYYLLAPDRSARDKLIEELGAHGVHALFHYVPLHSAAAAARYSRVASQMAVTDEMSDRLLRLPLWADMQQSDIDQVITEVTAAVHRLAPDS